MALRGAEILASFLATGAEDLERRVFQDYPAAWAEEFGRRMRWAASLRTLLRVPTLPDLLFQTLSKSPNLGNRFVEATRSPLPAQRALQNGINPSSRRLF
jgi:flavin-dependent dehydrogenase